MAIGQQEFKKIFYEFEKIKDCYAVEKLKFYKKRVGTKHKFAQLSGWAILILSLTIPFVSHLESIPLDVGFPKDLWPLIVSVMSLIIALINGLEGIHQWKKTWQDYSKAIVDIETFICKWANEAAAAQQLSDPEKVTQVLKDATNRLVNEVELTVEAEMGGFFAARQKAQPNDSGSP